VAKFAIEAMEEGEDKLPIGDRIARLGEGGGHRLKATAVIRDGEGALLERAELGVTPLVL
jgi:hypothetical protein